MSIETSQRIRDQFDRIPPVTVDEVKHRTPPVGHRSRVPVLGLVVALTLIIAVAVTVGVVRDRSRGEDVRAGSGRTDPGTSSPPSSLPDDPASASDGWPLLLAGSSRPEVLGVNPMSGEVASRFTPETLADGGLTGATGSPDGRIAVWSGYEVAVSDGEDVYEAEPVPVGVGELRIVLVPFSSAAWIIRGSPTTTVWKWDYKTEAVESVQAELPPGSSPAGVTTDGHLVLNSESPLAGSPATGAITIVGPDVDDAPRSIDGLALAVHRTSAVVRRCVEGECSLLTVDLPSGSSRAIDTGPVDQSRVRSLIGPTVPSSTAPLPTGDPTSPRVLVGVETGRGTEPHDQPVVVGVIDLDAGVLDLPGGSPRDVYAAAWRCDGEDIVAVGSGRTLSSLSGTIEGVTLPEGTNLYGVGACQMS